MVHGPCADKGNAADTPLGAPRREAPDQEVASVPSMRSSKHHENTSTKERHEESLPPLCSSVSTFSPAKQVAPGAFASRSSPKKKSHTRLALADGPSMAPSLDSTRDNLSKQHSSNQILTARSEKTSANFSSSSMDHTEAPSPGAQAIGGIKSENETQRESGHMTVITESSAAPDMTPVAAEVYYAETSIDAQVEDIENRLRQEFLNKPPPSSVHAEAIVNEASQKTSKGRAFWIVFAMLLLLVVGGAVATVAGVMSSRNNAVVPPAPPTNPVPSTAPSVFTPPCTLCIDGSQADLDAEIRRGYTCADLEADLAQLDSPVDSRCLAGQAKGWFSCTCPTLPRRPTESICSAVCPVDSRPPASDSQLCRDFETYVKLAGEDMQDCAALIAQTPEECICSTKIEQLRGLVSSISSEEDLFDTTTPQYMAMVWLANEDPANLDISATPLVDVQSRYFGALLWYSLGGENWINQCNFMSADGICDWNDGSRGLLCSESRGTLLTINIEQNNLLGTLPGLEMTAFASLEVVALGSNDIRGTIPSSIDKLSSLRIFTVDENEFFEGTLPSSLFNLRRLARLWLDNCNLSGSLPSNVGAATSLTSLSVPSAGLTGTIPTSISQLVLLTEIFLNGNSLAGPLPSLSNMLRLTQVNFFGNELNGTIPDHYGQSSVLERIVLAENELTGSIPDFSESLSLKRLYLQVNRLSGNLTRFFNTTRTDRLAEVSLRNNQLTGTIPESIGSYTNLEYLWLHTNLLLRGTLPTELGLLTSLTGALDLSVTSLEGTIPTELGNLTVLRELDFAECRLRGQIPSELGEMTALTFLDLNSNQLTGTIPSEIGNLQNLEQISFADNRLTGTVPTVLATLPNIESILLQVNELTGTLDPFCDRVVETIRADCEAPAEITCECCECF